MARSHRLGDVEPAQQPRSASCGPAPDPSVPGKSLFAAWLPP